MTNLKPGFKVKIVSGETLSFPGSEKYKDAKKEDFIGGTLQVVACGTSGDIVLLRTLDGKYFCSISEKEIKAENSVYIAGPITGYNDKNIPAFESAEKVLKEAGFYVINPHKIDHSKAEELERNGASEEEIWQAYLEKDLEEAMKAKNICLLENWINSDGANLEAFVLYKLGKTILKIENNEIIKIELKANLIIEERW
jgi:hypothetical protein